MLAAFPALCEGNPPVGSRFHSQKASNAGFVVAHAISLNKLLIKQLSCQWFEMSKGTQLLCGPNAFTSLHKTSGQFPRPAGWFCYHVVYWRQFKLVLCSKLLAVFQRFPSGFAYHFYLRPVLAFGYCRCLRLWPKMQKTLVKVPITLWTDRPWPSRSNLTLNPNLSHFEPVIPYWKYIITQNHQRALNT